VPGFLSNFFETPFSASHKNWLIGNWSLRDWLNGIFNIQLPITSYQSQITFFDMKLPLFSGLVKFLL